ncbi:hypothetical protein [Methylobacterium sp. A54F]
MKIRSAAMLATIVLGVAAPTASALAFTYDAPRGRYMAISPYELDAPGGFGAFENRNPATCRMSSAAEGNANQQNFPVKQYGQTAGGNRC